MTMNDVTFATSCRCDALVGCEIKPRDGDKTYQYLRFMRQYVKVRSPPGRAAILAVGAGKPMGEGRAGRPGDRVARMARGEGYSAECSISAERWFRLATRDRTAPGSGVTGAHRSRHASQGNIRTVERRLERRCGGSLRTPHVHYYLSRPFVADLSGSYA